MCDHFPAPNGVKQGGVLSPVLVAVYIDELLCRLNSGYGCTIGHIYCGVFGYAAGIPLPLASPTIHGLEQMYAICRNIPGSLIYGLVPLNFNLCVSAVALLLVWSWKAGVMQVHVY